MAKEPLPPADRPYIPEPFLAFVKRQAVQLLADDAAPPEEQRAAVVLPLRVQPLNAAGQPDGEPFDAVSRFLSPRGLGFVFTRVVTAKLLDVTLHGADSKKRLVAEVLQCRPVAFYYDVVCRFVVSLTSPAEKARVVEQQVERLEGQLQRIDTEVERLRAHQQTLAKIVERLEKQVGSPPESRVRS